jgi:DNA polymerase sigma
LRYILDQVFKANDIEQQIETLLNIILLNEIDYEKRIRLKEKLQEILFLNDFQCVLHFLGSTVNKLGFRDSDIDLYVELINRESSPTNKISFDEAMRLLTNIQRILKSSFNFFIPKPIPSIRCPLIRIDFNEMFKNFETNGVVCDLSLSNGLGQQNSKLIRLFCDFEPRFQQLCVILKYWAKMNGFIGSNEMSSYAFTQLVIFFCQNLSPPLLPTVDYLRELTHEEIVIDRWNCGFCDNISLILETQRNKETVLELLLKFFQFYSNFDFTTQVICTKTGLSRHKINFLSENDFSGLESRVTQLKTDFITNDDSDKDLNVFKLTPICCIEDPFNLDHNLTAHLRIKVFHKFTEYLKSISMNSKTIFNSNKEVIDSNDIKNWGISRIITEFDPTLTGYVFPEHFIGYPNIDLVLNTTKSLMNLNEIIETMANNLSHLMVFILKDIFKIDCLLLGKWDIIVNQLSPFAEFYVIFRGLDYKVIDDMTREEIRSELNENELRLNYFDREKLITQKIIKKFGQLSFDLIPIHCQFVFIMNSIISFPTFELGIVDIKPSFDLGLGVINFIKKVIARAADEQKLLTVSKELLLNSL